MSERGESIAQIMGWMVWKVAVDGTVSWHTRPGTDPDSIRHGDPTVDDMLEWFKANVPKAWDIHLKYKPYTLGWGEWTFSEGFENYVSASTVRELLAAAVERLHAQLEAGEGGEKATSGVSS